MNTQALNNEQLQYLLTNAFDLLEDVKDKMGMFQEQRYYRLKKELESKQVSVSGSEHTKHASSIQSLHLVKK